MSLTTILESGYVQRFHAQPHIPKQDLAQHQWRVAVMLSHFYSPVPSEALMYALTHDCAELLTGDIPAPTKRLSESLSVSLSEMEDEFNDTHQTGGANHTTAQWRARVKLCDMIEGLRYCAECVMTGNQFAKEVGLKWASYLEMYPHPQTPQMIKFIAAQTKILQGE